MDRPGLVPIEFSTLDGFWRKRSAFPFGESLPARFSFRPTVFKHYLRKSDRYRSEQFLTNVWQVGALVVRLYVNDLLSMTAANGERIEPAVPAEILS